ncbi:hypothetical protein [Trinickia symbiotica]|uniref:Secreted protein n=1 Tax=Trinickia symbiotica TaxID=863227 RepID=A0A2N7WUZ7_9BURK|nr:hypothetical protein [Trinickia symbiotica]PMS33204.1 hypothetical protein C0Z20_24660 [Trinickia symbiotica]
MKTTLPLFALLVIASICRAEEPASVTSRKMADCTVPDVIGVRMYESDRRVAELSPTTMPLLDKMKALADKAHDPKRPVGEQLSGKDNEQLGEIRSRLMALQWHRLIESRYSKHLQLIEEMTESVDAKYRWGRDPDEKSSDYMADVTPAILQDISPVNTFNPPKEDHCTLVWALYLQEQPSLAALNAPELDAAAAAAKQLQQKYHVAHVDRNALSPDDQRIFDQAQTTLVRMQRDAAHAQQIEQIKTMVEASDLIYDTSMKDFDQSAGDPDSSIDTLKQMEKDGKLSAQMVMRVNVWLKLDEKYPSTEAAGLDALKKATSAAPSK